MAADKSGKFANFTCYSRILGQERAKRLIERALSSDRLPHAFLFKGPDGVGKKLFAQGLAAALNCRASIDHHACGQCVSCRKYQSGNHPDFMAIEPDKGAIKIDQVREMIKALSYPPYESVLRIVLLVDVHTMRAEAANSLLKTLEEPPPGNLLILTAEAAKDVLTTISSRCQVIPFFPLAEEQTVEVLYEQHAEIDRNTASMLAKMSEGSPGRALLMYSAELIAVMEKIGGLLTDPESSKDYSIGKVLKMAEEMAALKENLPFLFSLLRIWFSNRLLGREQGLTVQKRWNSREIFGRLQAIDRAEKELLRNCNRNLVCEVLLFRLLH